MKSTYLQCKRINNNKNYTFIFVQCSYIFIHIDSSWSPHKNIQISTLFTTATPLIMFHNFESFEKKSKWTIMEDLFHTHTHMYIHNFPRLKLYTLAKGIYIYRLKRSSKGDNSPVMLSHARIVLRCKNFPFVPFQFIKFAWRETTTIFIRCIA